MKFSDYRPGARKFTSRLSRISPAQSNHPFTQHSSFNKRRFWIRFFGLATTLTFFGLIAAIVGTLFLFVVFAKDLPSPNKLTVHDSSLSTKIFDRNGKLLYDIYGEKNRALVDWKNLPQYVKQATVSIEDKNFYNHAGFSITGIVRSAISTVIFGRVEGGSTITQQVVKNTLLSPEQTITRKIKEFILAIQVERKYSKDEILQIYLNEVPYGGTAWGIEAAAQTYFNKEAKDLTLTEAAILAGLPQSPTYYSPFGTNPKAYAGRAKDVARRMREDGYITSDQEKQIDAEIPEVKFAQDTQGIKAPHFVFYVRDLLVKKYGEKFVEQGGLSVKTTLDLDLQNKAQQIVTDEVGKLSNYHVGNGSAIVADPKTGQILVMVGSKDYFAKDYDGQVNVALALRQPGSSLKPFTYATGLKAGYTAATVLMDVSTEFPGGAGQPPYKPVNYDGKFRGPIQVRFALGNSINVTAVKMLAMVGIKNMLRTAFDSGLTTLEPSDANLKRFGLSVTLGGGEIRLVDLVDGYGTLANSGKQHNPVAILEVKDSGGKVLDQVADQQPRQVISPDIAFIISHILSDNNARSMEFGTGSLLNVPGRTVAVKTGTTDDKRDNWAVGYTPSMVVGVWVGNNDNTPMNQQIASGVTGATPIWNKIMQAALEGKKDEGFQKPDNVNAIQVDAFGGGLPCPGYPVRSEYFVKGTEPTKDCAVEKKLNGQDYYVFTEFDPVSTDGVNRWQQGIDAWEAGQGDSKYHPPGELLNQPNQNPDDISVSVTSPGDHNQVDYSFETKATISTGRKITKVEFYVDETLKDSTNSSDSSAKFNFTFASANQGKHKLRVKAYNEAGKLGEKEITVSVGVPWTD